MLGIFGALLLCCISQRYRVDVTRCAVWPSLTVSVTYAALYGIGLACLSVAWLDGVRRAATPDRQRPWGGGRRDDLRGVVVCGG